MRVCVQDYFILHLFIDDEKILCVLINYKLLKITIFPFKSSVYISNPYYLLVQEFLREIATISCTVPIKNQTGSNIENGYSQMLTLGSSE